MLQQLLHTVTYYPGPGDMANHSSSRAAHGAGLMITPGPDAPQEQALGPEHCGCLTGSFTSWNDCH